MTILKLSLIILFCLNHVTLMATPISPVYFNQMPVADTQLINGSDHLGIIPFKGNCIVNKENDQVVGSVTSIFLKAFNNRRTVSVLDVQNADSSSAQLNLGSLSENILNNAFQQHITTIVTGEASVTQERKMIKRCKCYQTDTSITMKVEDDKIHANKVKVIIRYKVIDVLLGEVMFTDKITTEGEGSTISLAYNDVIRKLENNLYVSLQAKNLTSSFAQQ